MFLFLSPLTFFGLPLFLFLFLCLSVVLFLFSFLLVFLFCFLFVSCFCLFLSFSFFIAFLSWKEKHQNIQLQFFSWNVFSFFVSCLAFLFQIPFSYLCFFLILSYVFCSTSMFFISKRTNWKAQKKQKKNNCNKTGFFFMNLCFAKCQKLSFFFASFFANFWLMFKKHYKNRYFSKFLKAKKTKKKCILRCYYLGQVGVIIWAKLTAS